MALLIIHVYIYIVIGRSEMGDVSMCRYRRYMYIWSSALLKRVASVCAIITDTSIYCRQRQFMQTTIYADDNSCNMYCRRRQFMQATIYAITRSQWTVFKKSENRSRSRSRQ